MNPVNESEEEFLAVPFEGLPNNELATLINKKLTAVCENNSEKDLCELLAAGCQIANYLNGLRITKPDLLRPLMEKQEAWPVMWSMHPQIQGEILEDLKEMGFSKKAVIKLSSSERWSPSNVSQKYIFQVYRAFEEIRFDHFAGKLGESSQRIAPELFLKCAEYPQPCEQTVDKFWDEIFKPLFLALFGHPEQHVDLRNLSRDPKNLTKDYVVRARIFTRLKGVFKNLINDWRTPT